MTPETMRSQSVTTIFTCHFHGIGLKEEYDHSRPSFKFHLTFTKPTAGCIHKMESELTHTRNPVDGFRPQVDSSTKTKPRVVFRLCDWHYLEKSTQRIMCAWARQMAEWDDKSSIHRHIWEQSECVQRLRDRISQFPGGNPDGPVSANLERLVNAVLLAPGFQDAIDGIYQLLSAPLMKAYLDYSETAHKVHDAPTLTTLHDIVGIKEQQRLWLRSFRRRYPHATNPAYVAAIDAELSACAHLNDAIAVEGDAAKPAGVSTGFRLPKRAARPDGTDLRYRFREYAEADFSASIEARRLYWAYGYLMEKNIPDSQVRWLYDSPDMPWEFHHNLSRHLWDESRHGDSGYSRFLDFGISLHELGFPPYEPEEEGLLDPLTPKELYEAIFFIGMIAESGHFSVKNEAYADFKAGGDMESAEMMLFDIIDETTHVQYAHRWLPILGERAGVDHSNFKFRAASERKTYEQQARDRAEILLLLPRDQGNTDYAFYQGLLEVMRERKPLSNANTCPPRSYLPL